MRAVRAVFLSAECQKCLLCLRAERLKEQEIKLCWQSRKAIPVCRCEYFCLHCASGKRNMIQETKGLRAYTLKNNLREKRRNFLRNQMPLNTMGSVPSKAYGL